MAKPSIIEARKAAAMESLAERLSAIENHLTGGASALPGELKSMEVEPIGPKLDALRDAITEAVNAHVTLEVVSIRPGIEAAIADVRAVGLGELAEKFAAMLAPIRERLDAVSTKVDALVAGQLQAAKGKG